MIRNFRHRGLERFFRNGIRSGIPARQENRIRLILARLSVSGSPRDMNLPGLRLHQLKGARSGVWSVRVSANWRITFGFSGPDAVDVDLEDYH